ncbi:2-keto-4-pentenoate hydratase [uncultured Dysosmobacter sp.]|uniref:2-keto-4-pentenoate hydratase n=1 Tax=uncultured Dysosmobacter sp. TaxID=2591384 RepID=UPI0026105D9D|nr:fumarylacetoacetate hydrolase family protein [uncultured Dysosmobacter sp.]
MTMDKERIAALLVEAQETATPLTAEFKQDFTLEESYAVQKLVRDEKVRRGNRVLGKKIGFTSRGMRERFNMPSPDYGNLFSSDMFLQGEPIDTSRFIAPKVEGEIAFLLKKDLEGPNVTAYDVLDATAGVMACLEFVDTRWGFPVQPIDTIADNAACGGFLLGSKMLPLENLDLRYIAMYMMRNGELINSGAGVEVMGDPINAMIWLANRLAMHGDKMHAGDIFLSGALTFAVDVKAGDNMSVCFSELGNIDVKFV